MTELPKTLAPAVERRPLHTRKVECQGYIRTDGLFDIEGRITDTKSYPFINHFRGEVKPGEAVHDMLVRITVDEKLTIVEASAVSVDTPYDICPLAALNFKRLKGIRIGPGYMRKIKERYGRAQGCTHILELMYPLGTTAFQTVYPYLEYQKQQQGVPEGETMRTDTLLNSCYAFSQHSPVVEYLWPDRYAGPREESEDEDAAA